MLIRAEERQCSWAQAIRARYFDLYIYTPRKQVSVGVFGRCQSAAGACCARRTRDIAFRTHQRPRARRGGRRIYSQHATYEDPPTIRAFGHGRSGKAVEDAAQDVPSYGLRGVFRRLVRQPWPRRAERYSVTAPSFEAAAGAWPSSSPGPLSASAVGDGDVAFFSFQEMYPLFGPVPENPSKPQK